MSQLRFASILAVLVILPAVPAASAQDSASCAFLASRDVRIGNASAIDGDLGVNDPGGQVRLGREVDLADGTTVAGDDVGASNGASLFDVDASRFDPGRGVVVRGTVGTPSLPLADPFCAVPAVACGGPAVVVRRGDPPRALSPGTYGDIVLENGTRLQLAPGVFEACSLRAGRGVQISVTGTAPSAINLAGELRLENGSTLGPVAGTATPVLDVVGDRVRLGAKARLEAFLAAPNARIRIRHGSSVTGSICSAALTTGHSVRFACSASVLPTTTTTSSTSSTTLPPTTSTTSTSTTTVASTTTTSSTTSTTTVSTTTSTTGTSSTTTAPSTAVPTSTSTTTTTSSTSSTTAPTTSSTSTTPPTTTSTSSTTVPTTTSSSTTVPTTTSTTVTVPSTTTSTTQPATVACGPTGIVARLAVPYDTRTLPALASIRFDVRYPTTVGVPGSGFETDDSRLTIVTGLDGSTIFVDRDDDLDGTDDTFRVAYALTGGRTFPPGDFADVLLDCTAGMPIDATAFGCSVLDAADPVGTSVPDPQNIPCVLESLTPQ